jgi:sulfoxide reductase heme-binding subunit YedZ
MNNTYVGIHFNPAKRTYDKAIAVGVGLYLSCFIALSLLHEPQATLDNLIIRGFGSLALILLHLVLAIGPLARLDERYLPLLYNRRHLGVTMFFCAFLHGSVALIQFQGWGNKTPLVSLFTTSPHYDSIARFPFQVPGFFALVFFFLMAATSHDFWLKNLGPRFWKTLHMGVYGAYALVLLHVLTGAAQHETSVVLWTALALGTMCLLTLHLRAAFISLAAKVFNGPPGSWLDVGNPGAIEEGCAIKLTLDHEEIAVFRYDGKISAVSNVCKHQNGPLSDGRIIAGCITCPWHGYQYRPEDGCSPPPFKEALSTYDVRLADGRVQVRSLAHPEGTPVPPLELPR